MLAVSPFPARGPATHLDFLVMPTRLSAAMSNYLRNEDPDENWVTPEAKRERYTLQEFNDRLWSRSATWPCRCGRFSLNDAALIDAAYAWSAERQRNHGNPTRPRRVMLT